MKYKSYFIGQLIWIDRPYFYIFYFPYLDH